MLEGFHADPLFIILVLIIVIGFFVIRGFGGKKW